MAPARGYEVKVLEDEESGDWTCYCARTILVTYDDVVAAQYELFELAADFGGYVNN